MMVSFAASYYLVLILFGASPSMVVMPLTYNKENCDVAGKDWAALSNNAYRRDYHCTLKQPGSEAK